MIQLYNYFRSSASFRVRIALNLKNISYEDIPIHLINQGGEQFSSDYQAINPQGLVPTFKDDDKIITQSLAIIEYLDETYPNPPLLSTDPHQKALIRSFALTIAADIHPLNNLRILKYLTEELKISEEPRKKWYQHWVTLGFTALEKQLVSLNDYCFGDKPTLADICLVAQMYNARRFSIDLEPYKTLTRIDAYCQKIQLLLKAWPNETSNIMDRTMKRIIEP